MGKFGNSLYGLKLRLGATIVDKIDRKFVPSLPPKSRMGKWLVLTFVVFTLDLGGGVGRREGEEDGGSMFHFILSKMVV